jgi:hypothetical protein
VISERSLVAATVLIVFFLGTNVGLSVGLIGIGSVLAVPVLLYGIGEKENVYKVTWPRGEVKVVVDGWTPPPRTLPDNYLPPHLWLIDAPT